MRDYSFAKSFAKAFVIVLCFFTVVISAVLSIVYLCVTHPWAGGILGILAFVSIVSAAIAEDV
jgi:hypothetical protein